MSTTTATEAAETLRHPSLFKSDFDRHVMIETHGYVSKSPRARKVGSLEVAMTGRVTFDGEMRRHLVEYGDAGGGVLWMSAGGKPAIAPDERHRLVSVPVQFTDGTRRR